ncbi:bidirectional sugar transporter SWEET10-like [Andrographis paniculata]|uniref:bidirectional sugar transporter SWEET10-like n=1 Tax=Andrographis paniculata TaxID=175694 RepID=UPI0021E70F89|nr:bidirectional sugar transporter SWEET10-like [Andrographis paniculata]
MDINFWITASGILGNAISFFVFLSPLPTFYKIHKKKSAEGFQSVPYIVSLFSAMLWIYYAFLKPNSVLLFTINSVGIATQTIYISTFIFYATKKARVHTLMLLLADIVGMGLIVVLTYFLQKGAARTATVGWICLVFSLCVFVAPLAILRRVIRTKSVEYMPFYLSFFLTISAVAWFFYGLLRKDMNIALPNVLGFVFGLIQMALYVLYKDSKKSSGETKQGTKDQQIIDVLKLSPFAHTMPSPADTIAGPWSPRTGPGRLEITIVDHTNA